MKNKRLYVAVLGLFLVGCGSGEKDAPQNPQQPNAKMACLVPTQALDIRDNGKGRTLVDEIRLSDIKSKPWTIGYGPALEPKAEITILDGRYYLTKPDGTATQTSHKPAPGQGATFIVTADGGPWRKGMKFPPAYDLRELSTAIASFAKAQGCTGKSVFPFKVKAHAKYLKWSITGAPTDMRGSLSDVDIIIAGIFDNSGEKRNAIMSGMNIHPHVVVVSDDPAQKLSGHLNAVELSKGAVIFVPQAHNGKVKK